MDVFKNGSLGYLAGFLILAALIVAIVLVVDSSSGSSSSPKIDVEWVAVGDVGGGYGSIVYSSNGQNWTKTSTGDSFAYGSGVAYGTSNGTSPLWVAVGDGTDGYGSIMYSNDGQSWTKTSTGNIFSVLGNGVAAKHLLYGMDPTYYTN